MLGDVRDAVAAQLQAALSEWTVYPRLVSAPATPALLILNGPASSRDGFTTRSVTYPIRVMAVTSMTDLESAQLYIDSLRERGGPSSLYDIIEADRTLSGVAQTVIPGDISEDQAIPIGDRGLYYGCWFDLDVTPTIT